VVQSDADRMTTPSNPAVDNTVNAAQVAAVVQAATVYGGVTIQHAVPTPTVGVPRQLRAAPAHFTDRARELAQLEAAADSGDSEVDRPCLAVITGPGGVGKTALALRWLHARAHRYPDGQLYADLGASEANGRRRMADTLGRFLRSLGVAAERVPLEVEEAVTLFRSVTAQRCVAVMVDNATSVSQVRALTPASPCCVVVVASRHRLGGLAADGAVFVPLEPLTSDAGARMLARTLGTQRVADEPDELTTLVRLCSGLPIALSVAAARLATRPQWSIARAVRDLTSETRRLSALSVDREVSVQSSFDLSYDVLPVEAAIAYRRLGLHPGPDFGADAAAAMLASTMEEAQQILETLVTASLLEETVADRFAFHDLLRLHARGKAEQHDSAETRDVVVRRAIEWYLVRAVAVEEAVIPLEWHLGPGYHERGTPAHGDARTDLLVDLERELPNVMAVLATASERGWDELAWRLCEAMWAFFLYRKHFPDWIAAYQLGAACARRCANLAAASRMHHHLGFAYHNVQRFANATEQGQLAVEAAREAGHRLAESEALQLLGLGTRSQGRFDEAIAHFQRAVALDHEGGRLRGEALGRRRLGQAYTAAGRFVEAVAQLRLAQQQAATLADDHVEAMTTVWLAEALTKAGQPNEAVDQLRRPLEIMSSSGSAQYLAEVHLAWGQATAALGDLPAASTHLQHALALFSALGAPQARAVQVALDEVHARMTQPPATDPTPPDSPRRAGQPGTSS
jgi:tetratricopeptide (TPR) repeat protein